MNTLIVGRFDEHNEAETTANDMRNAGFHPRAMSLIYVSPDGQHDLHPLGGDEDASPGTHDSQSHALRGAAGGSGAGALIGMATIPVLGPAGPLLGAAVGAYTGSLVGALSGMDPSAETAEQAQRASPPDTENAVSEPHKPGVLLAVSVNSDTDRAVAIDLMVKRASEVEETTGEVQDGLWVDFDPLHRPASTDIPTR